MCFNFEPTARKCRVCGKDALPIRGISKPVDLCMTHFVTISKDDHRLDKIADGLRFEQVPAEDVIDPRSAPLAILGPGGDYTQEIR